MVGLVIEKPGVAGARRCTIVDVVLMHDVLLWTLQTCANPIRATDPNLRFHAIFLIIGANIAQFAGQSIAGHAAATAQGPAPSPIAPRLSGARERGTPTEPGLLEAGEHER